MGILEYEEHKNEFDLKLCMYNNVIKMHIFLHKMKFDLKYH